MKPTYRLILLALIILVFGAVPAVHAEETTGPNFSNAEIVVCGDPAEIYSRSIGVANEIDVYSVELVAGQVLTIDVDTADNGAILDTVLDVYADTDPNTTDDTEIPIISNDKSSEDPINEDPYLEIITEKDGTYYLVIYAAAGDQTGVYSFSLKCTDSSTPTDLPDPVKVGDLLGATGSDSGLLLSINPADGGSTVRFPFEYGKIADIEIESNPVSKKLFVTIDNIPGSIIVVDPDTGTEIQSFSYESGGFLALESVENTLYGIYVYFDTAGFEQYTLVTINQATGATSPVALPSKIPLIRSLAYHPAEKVLYGANGADLIKFDLKLSPVEITKVGSTVLDEIVALDFDPNNTLYCVDRSGNLFKIPDLTLTTEPPVKIGPIDAKGGVKGLTFVVGDAQDVEPIKTVCSSELTSTNTASSETDVPKLARLRLKQNPLHRAIGLFKFQGKAGEKVTLRLAADGEEAPAAGEDYTVSTLAESWLKCKGQGRVFLSVRDAIPNIDFRVRKKAQIPFDMSADLPQDGYYYIMVIRPLLRFYQTDYCLTLESDNPESQAWQTLDVVWPGDGSEDDTATALTEAKTEELQSDEVSDEESLGSENIISGEITGVVPTLTASEPVSVAPASSAPEPLDEGGGQQVQTEEETAVDETAELAPAEQPPAEATVEPVVMGAPPIVEETAVDETAELAPEKSADVISGDDGSADGSGSAEVAEDFSDGAESAEGDTTNVVEEDPTDASKS